MISKFRLCVLILFIFIFQTISLYGQTEINRKKFLSVNLKVDVLFPDNSTFDKKFNSVSLSRFGGGIQIQPFNKKQLYISSEAILSNIKGSPEITVDRKSDFELIQNEFKIGLMNKISIGSDSYIRINAGPSYIWGKINYNADEVDISERKETKFSTIGWYLSVGFEKLFYDAFSYYIELGYDYGHSDKIDYFGDLGGIFISFCIGLNGSE